MSKVTIKKINHLLPRFIIRYWNNGMVFNKKSNKVHHVSRNDYAKKFYYSLGKKDDKLENRIAVFEGVISKVISKVDNSNYSVTLSGKEIELLKLFCVLSAIRHDNTSSVINDDETGYHMHNEYIFGVNLIETQKEAVLVTSMLMDAIEDTMRLSDDTFFYNSDNFIFNTENQNAFTMNQHLGIIRNEQETNLVSEVCAIVETTIDSNYLYTYVPISPKTSLLLINSSYYNELNSYYSKLDEYDDPYLSLLFNYEEDILFHSYNHVRSNVHINEEYLFVEKYNMARVLIDKVSEDIFKDFNSIIYSDGTKILFTNEKGLNDAKENKLLYRKITFK